MESKRKSKLTTEEVMPKSILEQNAEALELYKETDGLLKETTDILEKIDIAMGRKKIYKYSSGSTQDFEIDPRAIPPAVQSYKV